MRIVVTGASGNIGSQLLAQLSSHDLVGVVRRPPAEGPLADAARWEALDLSRSDAVAPLSRLLVGADAVVHLAWLLQPSHDETSMAATNVDGTRAVLAAVRKAGVPALVYASSVGVYSPGPKDRRVDESWPTEGIQSSTYSRHKVAAERLVDRFEADLPQVRVARVRPGVVVQRQSASSQARYFLGALVPMPLIRPSLLPVVPALPGLAAQIVHAEDVAAVFAAAVTGDGARGAYNAAGEPVITPGTLGSALSARPVPVPAAPVRAAVNLTWRLRLHPTDPGWLDLALSVPLMDTGRARRELGWAPRHDTRDALLEVIDGIHSRSGGPSPVLRAVRGPLDQVVSGVRAVLPRLGARL